MTYQMKNLLLPLFAILLTHVQAQTDQKEINEQVWKLFTKAIMAQDVESFISVHSKDVVRAERSSKKILNYEQYKNEMLGSWPKWKARNAKDNVKYTFELRFLERISNGTQAFEVGYFKNETVKPTGEKEIYYGKFQVALRKENGIWKILVDSDSNQEGIIIEKDFLAAKPLE
jgi:ketosteroid isomerase-like protein